MKWYWSCRKRKFHDVQVDCLVTFKWLIKEALSKWGELCLFDFLFPQSSNQSPDRGHCKLWSPKHGKKWRQGYMHFQTVTAKLNWFMHHRKLLAASTIHQAPVVQMLDSAIHWINHYPLDNSIGFASVYPLDSDLSGGHSYPSFEQLGQGGRKGGRVHATGFH